MNMKFDQGIKLFNGVYKNNSWWLFDSHNLSVVVKNHDEIVNIEAMEFYYKQQIFVNINKLLKSTCLKKLANNSIIEIIGLNVDQNQPRLYMFELHKLSILQSFYGIMLVCVGDIELFCYAHLLNCLLFHGEKRLLPVSLSEREREILYFIMFGKTYGEISSILSDLHGKTISASCIGKIVRNSLYTKFNIWNKFELRQQLLQSDWINKVPHSILNFWISEIRKKVS